MPQRLVRTSPSYFGAGAVKGGSGKVGIYNPYLVTIFAFMFSILAMVIIIMIARLKAFHRRR